MTYTETLKDMRAPPKIVEAAQILDSCTGALPADLVQYVCQWVAKHRSNDRYGK